MGTPASASSGAPKYKLWRCAFIVLIVFLITCLRSELSLTTASTGRLTSIGAVGLDQKTEDGWRKIESDVPPPEVLPDPEDTTEAPAAHSEEPRVLVATEAPPDSQHQLTISPAHTTDVYKEAKLKFQQNLKNAGPLAILTPRQPSALLRPIESPRCSPGKFKARVWMGLTRAFHAKFSMAIWNRQTMAKYGFEPVSKADDADILLLGQARRIPQADKALQARKKVILVSKADDVTRGSDYQHLEHTNFLGIMKEFVYRSLGDYLEPRWFGRALSFHICDSHIFKSHSSCDLTIHGINHTMTVEPKLRPAWSKVRSVSWNWEQYYPIMRHLHEPSKDFFDYERDLDVFMSVHLRDEPGSLARAQVVVALRHYSGPKQLHLCKAREGVRAFPSFPNTCLSAKAYSGWLKRTKIVVCPWGFGERTSCEQGGWFAGAVVIKPWTDFVVAFPDMYRNGSTYVAVQPDYGDLQSAVSNVVNHWGSYKKMRIEANKLFVSHVRPHVFTEHFWATVCDLNRGSASS